MVFSSQVFLFLFFPLVFIFYYQPFFKSRRFKNSLLLLASLFFYAWGESLFVFVMLFSIAFNFFIALKMNSSSHKKLFLSIAVIYNLSLLFLFKYLSFFIKSITIALPIGISFFTFQVLSYVYDVYYKKTPVQKNIFDLALYISLFPQLIAGPIVRYESIADQIQNRQESIDLITKGFSRFVIGLGKKCILANKMAIIADMVFNWDISEMTSGFAWLGAITYSLQIYLDFSGYSDMAIGLGQIFGFNFEENFNYPYLAKSITDFWRRWHISLSSWFRDYVYIPLGGNRCSKIRNLFNLFIVWLLTGIWHGANWTFWIWGLYYFFFLVIERKVGLNKLNNKFLILFWRVISIIIIILGWVLFRSDSIINALLFIRKMFSFQFTEGAYALYIIKNGYVMIILSVIACFPIIPFIKKQSDIILNKSKSKICFFIIYLLGGSYILIVFVYAILSCISSSYNPFIYFNF